MAIQLTVEQNAIINSKDPVVCVIACAGSGKTTTITRKIARLINTVKATPSSVVAITFTVLAANKLSVDLSKLLNNKSHSSLMFIGTIHSFCFKSLTDGKVITSEAYEPITESQQYILLNKYWNEWGLEKISTNKPKTIEKLITTFDIIKMNRLNHKVLYSEHPEVFNIYQNYNNYLLNNGYLDYADMLVEFEQALHDIDFKENIFSKYKYFFIDEYQDVDPVQASIVNILKKNANVCVVGDDDQAIYQFRGADERNIQDFANDKRCKVYNLSENRRSPKNILHAAEKCITRVKRRLPKSMKATTKNGLIVTKIFNHIDDEANFISSSIAELLNKGLIDDFGQVAILLRSVSSHGQIYIEKLKNNNIPYVAKGARGLFATPELQEIMKVFEWFAKEDLTINALPTLDKLLSKPIDITCFKDDDFFSISKKEFISNGYTPNDYELIKSLYGIFDKYIKRKFANLLELTHEIFSILNSFDPTHPTVWKLNLAYLTQIISDYEKIQDNKSFRTLFNYLNVYAQNTFDEKSSLDQISGAINILTVHQAKGLDYDYVFIPMVVDKRFPLEISSTKWLIKDDLFDHMRYKTIIDNERRLFYVTLTRARKGVYVLCSKNVKLKREKNPSIFFEEVSKIKLKCPNIIPSRRNMDLKNEEHLITSYSALEYYLTCPYRYYLNIELGIHFPQLIFFQFGKLIHDLLAKINRAHINNVNYTLVDAKQYLEDNFPLYYKNTNMRQYDIGKQKLRAINILENYYRDMSQWLSSATHSEEDFIYVADEALVRGRFDLITKDPFGNYTIIDYKTGQFHYRLSSEFQMQFYALTARSQLNLQVKNAVLYFIENNKPVTFNVTSTFIRNAETRLENIIFGIKNKDFKPTPEKEVCKQCEGKKICPYKK